MKTRIEKSIELEENCIMFMDVEILCEVTPGEPQTYDDPGCDSTAEMLSVHVTAFGSGDLKIHRFAGNEACFKVLDNAATEYVATNWDEDYEYEAIECAAEDRESYLADRYERD